MLASIFKVFYYCIPWSSIEPTLTGFIWGLFGYWLRYAGPVATKFLVYITFCCVNAGAGLTLGDDDGFGWGGWVKLLFVYGCSSDYASYGCISIYVLTISGFSYTGNLSLLCSIDS